MNALAYHRAGLRNIVEAAILEVAGLCGTAGLTLEILAGALRIPENTLGTACRRLIRAGLLEHPSRDTKRGRPNRYRITPAALAILRCMSAVTLPAQQLPLSLP